LKSLLKSIIQGIINFLNIVLRQLSVSHFIPADNHEQANHSIKWTRKDIVFLLGNKHSHTIDLSNHDLVEVDFSGLDLRGIDFSYCRLRKANLSDCLLQDAKFVQANCRDANFSGSDLSRTDFSFAYLRYSNLTQTHLYRAVMDGADFSNADLRGANLYRASLVQVQRLSREAIGNNIIQESLKPYKTYHQRLLAKNNNEQIDEDSIDERIARYVTTRLREGVYVYRVLKTMFADSGQYADASWAYVKERQLKRQMHGLSNARNNFQLEFPVHGRFIKIRQFGFYLKHFYLWLLDWAAELSCGYGERPLRSIFLALITLLIFPAFYALSGGVVSEAGQMTWLDYFNYSFATFTTLGFNQFSAVTPLAQTISSIEGLIGISILALLMFALGNRISRA
jgi:uncharacterized protein YjbI with pentapeptide repeats